MDNKQEAKYNTLNISDHIRVIGELEHIYFHAQRSKQVAKDTDDEVFYQVIANHAKDIRREYMRTYFPDCDEKLWCLGKASASLKQATYESDEGNTDLVRKIDDLADEIWGKITGKQLYGCQSCIDDKNGV